jgi:hypothetical protein
VAWISGLDLFFEAACAESIGLPLQLGNRPESNAAKFSVLPAKKANEKTAVSVVLSKV